MSNHNIVTVEKPYILFLSTNNSILDTFPEELNEKWDFQLLNTLNEIRLLDILYEPKVVVIDTYSLDLSFVEVVRKNLMTRKSFILVIDEYHKKIFTSKIIENGADDYLHIDDFNEGLNSKIENLLQRD